jgi:TPP-dependent pyruvate/acetoin dehydrogenase alpha subunit
MDCASLESLYETMLLIRAFEQRVEDLYTQGALGGTTHLSIGQEAAAAGVLAALGPDDRIVSHHRGHGHALARGCDPGRLMAELMGRQDGYCRGKGGSQHVCVMARGFVGTNGITGGGIPVATGAALALKRLGAPGIVAGFFGDGATNQGAFHESLNMAALWALPVLYVCENNQYAMSTPLAREVATGDLAARAAPYGIASETVDGMDVEVVHAAARAAVARVRGEGRPFFLVAETYRFCGHSRGDPRVYRAREEEAAWRARDPLTVAEKALRALGRSDSDLEHFRARAAARVDAAHAFAEASPEPAADVATTGVYADG